MLSGLPDISQLLKMYKYEYASKKVKIKELVVGCLGKLFFLFFPCSHYWRVI